MVLERGVGGMRGRRVARSSRVWALTGRMSSRRALPVWSSCILWCETWRIVTFVSFGARPTTSSIICRRIGPSV